MGSTAETQMFEAHLMRALVTHRRQGYVQGHRNTILIPMLMQWNRNINGYSILH